jgi:hypothetical protein
MSYDQLSKHLERVRRGALGLAIARAAGLTCVVHGDNGGQVYFTAVASQMSCTPSELTQLIVDVDYLNWCDPFSVILTFESIESGKEVGGGMGGGLVTDSVWIHEAMRGSVLATRIEEVLSAKRRGLWPSGSSTLGEPRNAVDVIALLEGESGNAPCHSLVRTAARLVKPSGTDDYLGRLCAATTRLLSSGEHRNRVEAAEVLLSHVDPATLVRAVYAAASGTIKFPKWGMWQRRAAYIVGATARANDVSAREALATFSRSDEWIAHCGPYAFAWPRWADVKEKYFDPAAFRTELSRLFGDHGSP